MLDSNGNLVPSTGVSEKPLAERYTGNLEPNYEFGMWVLVNDNMDYLKCPDELNWETKTSCE